MAATPTALRPVKKMPPGANRSITGDSASGLLAGTPNRNSWPTRARGVIASSVACAQDTGSGADDCCTRAREPADVSAGPARSGVTPQAATTAHAATAPPIRSRRHNRLAHHNAMHTELAPHHQGIATVPTLPSPCATVYRTHCHRPRFRVTTATATADQEVRSASTECTPPTSLITIGTAGRSSPESKSSLIGYLSTGVTVDARPGSVEALGGTLSHRHERTLGRSRRASRMRTATLSIATEDGTRTPEKHECPGQRLWRVLGGPNVSA